MVDTRRTRPEPGAVRVLVLGAAGRDFHCFNTVYRGDPSFEVVAFTAAQIPGIAHRRYPAALAGDLYPNGIPIEEEAELEALRRRFRAGLVVLAYSDLEHAGVMHLASRALGYGEAQRAALRRTIEASAAEIVESATPMDLAALLGLEKPVVRVRYELREVDEPGLGAIVDAFVAERLPRALVVMPDPPRHTGATVCAWRPAAPVV